MKRQPPLNRGSFVSSILVKRHCSKRKVQLTKDKVLAQAGESFGVASERLGVSEWAFRIACGWFDIPHPELQKPSVPVTAEDCSIPDVALEGLMTFLKQKKQLQSSNELQETYASTFVIPPYLWEKDWQNPCPSLLDSDGRFWNQNDLV